MHLEQVGEHCYAVLSPGNRLCEANSGMIDLGGGVVIDTQCDLGHARQMIELCSTVNPDLPERVVITHEDADHVWGNQLFPGAQIIAQRKIHERMPHTADPRNLQRVQSAGKNFFTRIVLKLTNQALLALADQLAEEFDFSGIELTLPNTLFDERYELDLEGTAVHLIHVGPGHQWGDTLVHVPHEGVLFCGDVLFRMCTPIGWAGTFSDWQRSLDLVLQLEPEVIVPGHGPVCGLEGPRELKAYLEYVYREAKHHFDRGHAEFEAAEKIDLGPYAEWNAPARLYFNVARAYREFRGEQHDAPWDMQKMFSSIYKLAQTRGFDTAY